MKFTLLFVSFVAFALPDMSDTPLEMANRGAQLYSAAKYPEAEALYRSALAAWPKDNGATRGRVIVLNNLGELLRVTGRYDEAELTINQALDLATKVGDAASPEAGTALDNLAVIYRTRGDLAKAETYTLRAAPLVNDRERPANRMSLATIYVEEGRFQDAQPLLFEALASADARTALTAAIVLSAGATTQGNLIDGELFARRAIALGRQALPPKHPALAMALYDLAQACRLQHHYLEAEQRYREAIEIWETALGRESADLANGLLGLAALYHERQREPGAETLYRRAIGILTHTLGESAPQVTFARTQLAQVLRSERRYTEADRLSGGTK